jgi:hypothetical protein
MVGQIVRDRHGALGLVLEWNELPGYRLGSGLIVRRYTAWVTLA